jgi:hypothetical protein
LEVVYKYEDPGFRYSHHRMLSGPGHSHINTPHVPAVSSSQVEFGAESLNWPAQATALRKAVATLDGWSKLFRMSKFDPLFQLPMILPFLPTPFVHAIVVPQHHGPQKLWSFKDEKRE